MPSPGLAPPPSAAPTPPAEAAQPAPAKLPLKLPGAAPAPQQQAPPPAKLPLKLPAPAAEATPPPAPSSLPTAGGIGVRPSVAPRPHMEPPAVAPLTPSGASSRPAARTADDLVAPLDAARCPGAHAVLLRLATAMLSLKPEDPVKFAATVANARQRPAPSPKRAASVRDLGATRHASFRKPAGGREASGVFEAPPLPKPAAQPQGVLPLEPRGGPSQPAARSAADLCSTLDAQRLPGVASVVQRVANVAVSAKPEDPVRFAVGALNRREATSPSPKRRESSPQLRRVASVAAPAPSRTFPQPRAAPPAPQFESRDVSPVDGCKAPPSVSPPRAAGSPPRAASASPARAASSPRDLLALPQHNSSPRHEGAASAAASTRRLLRRAVAPSPLAMQRFENAADPQRLDNSFVQTTPRVATDKHFLNASSNGAAAPASPPSSGMLQLLHEVVRREVTDSMRTVHTSPGARAQQVDEAQQQLSETQRQRLATEAELAALREEERGWTDLERTRQQYEARIEEQAHERDRLERDLDALRSAQRYREQQQRAEQQYELHLVEQDAQQRVHDAMRVADERSALLEQQREALDAAMASYRAQRAEPIREPTRVAPDAATPVIGEGPDALLMRKKLELLDVQRRRELHEHAQRSAMHHSVTPVGNGRASHVDPLGATPARSPGDMALHPNWSAPRSVHSASSGVQAHIPAHFTPVRR